MTKPRHSQAPRLDLYQQVTNQIIATLEQGVRPWTKPWSADHLATRVSRPLRACGKGYQGINVLILWLTGSARGYQSPFWLTFKQALDLGGHVRKGEKGAPVCYYDTFTKEMVDDTGASREEQIPFLKHYTVFNAQQCDGLPAHFCPPAATEPTVEPEAGRIAAVDSFIANLGAEIIHGGNRACYAQQADRISMPPFAIFTTPDAYYSTLLHEVIHWTKHPVRLNRDCGRKQWGDEGYAREELVAELGSAYLCADLEIDLSEREDHASYIASWLAILENDKRAIFHAAAMAERAATWLHARHPGPASVHPSMLSATIRIPSPSLPDTAHRRTVMIDLRHRLDGAVARANLSPDVQSAIGAAAINLIAAWVGLDVATDDDPDTTPARRAFGAADSLCGDRLLAAVIASVSSLDPDQPPLPACLGQVCHGCGCSEHDFYDLEDRVWLPSGLCSVCGPPASPISI